MSRPVTSGIKAGQKFFNNMVLSSVDPGGQKSFSPKSCTVTDEAVVLEAVGVPPHRTRCWLLASNA